MNALPQLMALTASYFRRHLLTAISVAVALGFCGLTVKADREALLDRWKMAAQSGSNLNQAINQEIGRTIESLDLSLQAVVSNRRFPGLGELAPEFRNMVLFDRAITAKHIGVALLLDDRGNVLTESDVAAPRRDSFADREYFTYHRDHTGDGMHISAPYRGRSTRDWVVAVSRRISGPDGGFAGVVMGTILLDSIRVQFSAMDLGPGGALTLFRDDGIVLMRVPYREKDLGISLSSTVAFKIAQLAPHSQFVATATLDNTKRLFTFSRIEGTSLMASDSYSVADIEAGWWWQTLYTGLITVGLVGALMAVTLRMQQELRKRQAAEHAVRESEAKFRLLAENSSDMVVRIGPDNVRRYVSPASQRLLGLAPETLVGHSPQAFAHPDDVAALTASQDLIRSGAAEETSVRFRARHADGTWKWLEGTIRVVRDPTTNKPDGFVAVSRDITERKALEAQLALLASLDGLTGIANRRVFDEALERESLRCARGGHPISLLLIDVDRFKALNDHYGHPCGDACLRQIGVILGGAVRRAGDLAARYGGEEFVILLPETDEAGALSVAERVRAQIEALGLPNAEYGYATAVVTASIGVSTLCPIAGTGSANAELLVESADRMLYEAKRTGRNRTVCSLETPTVY